MKIIKKILKGLKVFLVLMFIFLEELAWSYFGKKIYDKIISFKITTRFQNWLLEQKNKYFVLMIFLLPFVPDNILTIYLGTAMANGMLFTVIGIYVLKALFSILTIMIFKISKKELVKFFLIKYGYGVLLNLQRKKYYRNVKKYYQTIKIFFINDYNNFKRNYLNGESSFKDEIKRIYIDLKITLKKHH